MGDEERLPPADLLVLVWPSAASTPQNRARSELFLNTLATVWGRELNVSLVEAVGRRTPPDPLTWEELRQLQPARDTEGALECTRSGSQFSEACINHALREARLQENAGDRQSLYLQRQVLRLPDAVSSRISAFEPRGEISQFLFSLSERQAHQPPEGTSVVHSRMRVVIPGIFDGEPVEDSGGLQTEQTVLLLLHGGASPGLRSDPITAAWGEIQSTDISALDSGQIVLRACEAVGHRRDLRCGQPEELSPIAHSEDARVSFEQTGRFRWAVVEGQSGRRRLPLPPVESSDPLPPSEPQPGTVEGRTLWTMPTSTAGFSHSIDDSRSRLRPNIVFSAEVRDLVAHGALSVEEFEIDGRPLSADALHLYTAQGGVAVDLPALTVGDHRARLRLRSARAGDETLEFDIGFTKLGQQVAGRFLRCAETDGEVLVHGASERHRGPELCFWVSWWSADVSRVTVEVGGEPGLEQVGGSARRDPMFLAFVVVVLFLSTLLWWRRPATHLAFQVMEEGDFRSAPASRWEVVPITGPGALSSLHEGLSESGLSLRRGVGGLVASGAKRLVYRTPKGELEVADEHLLESCALLFDGERAFAFIDDKFAGMLKTRDWDLRMPDVLDVSIARSGGALIKSVRRRRAIQRSIGRTIATLVLWATGILGPMGLSVFYPALSQRGPFIAASLSIVSLAIVAFRASQRARTTSLLRKL